MSEFEQYYDLVKLSSDGQTSTIEILKVGTIYDRGIKITDAMLDDYVHNFEQGTYGTEIQVNLKHDRDGEAAGWIKKVYKLDGVLFAEVEWTQLGMEKITSKQFRYTSSELALSYTEPKTGAKVKNVLIGVALTNIPAVKGMAPVTLSEEAPISKELFLSLNSIFMKDKVKAMYDGLMKKDAVSEKEMAEFADLCKDAGEEPTSGEMTALKKKMSSKPPVKKLSEGEDDEENANDTKKQEDEKLSEKNDQKVSLSEFNKMKKLVDAESKANKELKEKLDRMDLKEEVSSELVLSEDNITGFTNDAETLSDVVNFMMSLSQEQRNVFKSLVAKVRTVDLSTIGNTVQTKNTAQSKEDQAIEAAEKRALELSQKTGRDYAECLSEEYSKLEEAKR